MCSLAGNLLTPLQGKMATVKGKTVPKTTISDLPLRLLRHRLSEDLPKQLCGSDLETQQRPSPLLKPKPYRTRLPAPLAGSPYARALLPRSLSVTKLQERGAKLGLARVDMSIQHFRPDLGKGREVLNLTVAEQGVNMSFGSSFDAADHLKSPKANKKRRTLLRTLKLIEAKLNKELRELADAAEEKRDRELHAYSHAFAQLIDLTSLFKPLLSRIKSKYEAWIQRFLNLDMRNLQQDLHRVQLALEQATADKAFYAKQLDKVAKENVELSRSCLEYQQKGDACEEKLREIARGKRQGYPPTEDTWKMLNLELDSLYIWREEMNKQIAAAKSTEKQLLGLLQAKEHPIEGHEGDKSTPFHPVSSAVPSLSASEPGHKDSLSAIEDTNKRKTGTNVPKLALATDEKRAEFHEEFMSKYEEFSESWRKAIDAQQHHS